jgi:integrase
VGIVEGEVAKCLKERRALNGAELRKKVWDFAGGESQEPSESVADWIDGQIPTLGVSKGTAMHYHTLALRVRACDIFNRWSDITTENIIKFDAWVRGLPADGDSGGRSATGGSACGCSVGGHPDGGGDTISGATVYNYHKCLKRMLTRAVVVGKIDRNPYDRLKGEFRRPAQKAVEYLTEEEVKAFVDYQPIGSRELEIAHDLFVVQLYTGLSYSDLMRFDFSNYRMVDGAWIAVDARVKTGVPFVGHLLSPVVAVLDKYGGTLPRMCNQRYNRCLKVLGPAVGIRLTLHSHLARHTFATMMLRAGAKIENVSRILGHTNITQTQHYAKVLAQSVHEDFELFARRLNN